MLNADGGCRVQADELGDLSGVSFSLDRRRWTRDLALSLQVPAALCSLFVQR